MLAVIKTGGKQYLVSQGQKIKIEKLEGAVGDTVSFSDVLLLENEGNVEIGMPILTTAKVSGKILAQGKRDKVIVFKYKNKTRRKTKKGHRQMYTEVEITRIEK